MVVTVVESVTSSRLVWVHLCPRGRGKEVPCSRGGKETADVKVREGGTETRISSGIEEERGSLVCWAIVDYEQVRMGLWLEAEA